MTNHDQLASGAYARKANQAYAAEKRRIEAGGAPFDCLTCFDTRTIDQGGAEVICPDCLRPTCPITVKLTGLAHGLGDEGVRYATATMSTSSTITFVGSRAEILRDVQTVRLDAQQAARLQGLTGRNHVSSGAIAIERRVRKALA